jgi:hypothetical protein
MTLELGLKIIAHGLFFTPNAVVRDVGGFMTLFIYASSFWYLAWMPEHVEENSWAQLLMICRAMASAPVGIGILGIPNFFSLIN